MSQQTQAPRDISPYAALPVTVISEPVGAIQQDKRPERNPKRCDWRLAIQPVVDGKKRLLGVFNLRAGQNMETLSQRDGAFQKGEHGLLGDLCTDFPQLPKTAAVQQAQALFDQGPWSHIPLVDKRGRYTGQCVSRQRLFDLLNGMARPVRIGGLATPLGVYMTSGPYVSGAGWQGLIVTGLLFGVVAHLLDAWILVAYSTLATLFPWILHLSEGQQITLDSGLMLCSLMALLRLSPMSGLHAAEHMTINAIEHDLPLLLPFVRSQPREHPRCGTNLMVLLAGVQLIGLFLYTSWNELNHFGQLLYATVGFIVVLKSWQPVGLWLQRNFTTKDPTDAQLESGIKAGRELLEKYRACPHPFPTLWQRIWGSGMIPMAVTFLSSAWLIGWLLEKWWGGAMSLP